ERLKEQAIERGRDKCAREEDGDFRYCRQCLSKPCRWFEGGRLEAELHEGPYGLLYGHSLTRARRGLSSRELSPSEHEELCFVCLSVFEGLTPARPEGSYEARERSVSALEVAGYVKRRGGKWHPTPSGFEASGLCGSGRLELDP